jgi:hypothetical protein
MQNAAIITWECKANHGKLGQTMQNANHYHLRVQGNHGKPGQTMQNANHCHLRVQGNQGKPGQTIQNANHYHLRVQGKSWQTRANHAECKPLSPESAGQTMAYQGKPYRMQTIIT